MAQAGTGGSDCPPGAMGPEGGPVCFGLTGALSEISDGRVRDVVTGLFSASDVPGGLAAEGISDVGGTRFGLTALFGSSVPGTFDALPSGDKLTAADSAAAHHQLGKLSLVDRRLTVPLADVGRSDYRWAAAHKNLVPGQFPDANPNAFAAVGSTTYVVDAASNTLDSVDLSGRVKQLAFIPNGANSDAVPTCVAVDPSNTALYIGQLAPFAGPDAGKVYRFDLITHKLTVWQTGFGAVDGCGFDRAGNFYAVEFQRAGFNPGPNGLGDPAGDIVKITPTGQRSVLGTGQLLFPQGFAVDQQGAIYVSNNSIFTGKGPGPTGEVVRVVP